MKIFGGFVLEWVFLFPFFVPKKEHAVSPVVAGLLLGTDEKGLKFVPSVGTPLSHVWTGLCHLFLFWKVAPVLLIWESRKTVQTDLI